jgi:hypothetical protein
VRCASFSTVTADRLAAAIDLVTHDMATCRRSTVLGERIRAEDGVEQAVSIIERYVPFYSRP